MTRKQVKFLPWLLNQPSSRSAPYGYELKQARISKEDWARRTLIADAFECFYNPKVRPEMHWEEGRLVRFAKRQGYPRRHGTESLLEAIELWKADPFVDLPLRAPSSPGVYCVSSAMLPDIVKIGSSRNIKKRVGIISVYHPGGVEMRAVLSLDPRDERKFHKKFRAHRIKGGEWFHVRGSLAEYLK